MKRILFCGGVLAGDLFAQTGTFVAHWQSEMGAVWLLAGLVGLLLSLCELANATFAALTEHGETFTL